MRLVEFRVTFGTDHIGHPYLPLTHPDGWLAVMAVDEPEARRKVFDVIGARWSFIYDPSDEDYPNVARYPLGEIGIVQ